ncbi:MAG: NAD-dependent epimerase/dehydratase family protein [Lachnospiraceae bacterium]|nr:NAD-dependent epimerase/dehydratase family protein [Lachnospiraceae bacterium]
MILILGGNGFLGYNFIKRISKREKVRVYDLNWSHSKDPENVEVIRGSFPEADFDGLLEGVDAVFHLISAIVPCDGTGQTADSIENTILPTIRLLEAMKRKGVSRLFFVSSGGTVYGESGKRSEEKDALNPECVYAAEKVTLEHYFHLYDKYDGIRCIRLRIANPYGLDMNPKKRQGIIPIFATRIISGETIEVWGDGENRRDYIYIDEVMDALERVYDYTGTERVFNIGTGESHTTNEIIRFIEEKVQKKADIQYLPARKCDIEDSRLNVSLIERECGWKSSLSVKEGIGIFIDKYTGKAGK